MIGLNVSVARSHHGQSLGMDVDPHHSKNLHKARRRLLMNASELLRVTRLCLPKLGLPDTAVRDESDLDVKTLCSLWSGMGHIYRIQIATTSPTAGGGGGRRRARANADQQQERHPPRPTTNTTQFIVKHVAAIPRRSQASFGDQRKADSYQVEANFYENCAVELLAKGLNLPVPLWIERHAGRQKNEIVIAMTYVEEESHSPPMDFKQKQNMINKPWQPVVTWLATLHAAYWGVSDETIQRLGLQPVGTYWHLDTRPDEHQNMPSTGWQGRLKLAARAIDKRLKRYEPFQCIVHGDAKDANILCHDSRNKNNNASNSDDHGDDDTTVVCFCDFQYCGKGVPAKDLAYFFCSSDLISPPDESSALEYYLHQLTSKLIVVVEGTTTTTTATIPTRQDLQDMMDLAYCDYYRFMSGWGFWGNDGGGDRVRQVLDRLDGGIQLQSEEEYDAAVQREYG
jgi:Phosphotransferase enzyme family